MKTKGSRKKRRLVWFVAAGSFAVCVLLAVLIFNYAGKLEEPQGGSAGGDATVSTADDTSGLVDESPVDIKPEREEGPFTILMVDDSEENQRVTDRFEKLGCVVTTVQRFEETYTEEYDALVIPGGGNVTPSMYGAERSEYTSDTNLEKDETQIEAIRAFVAAGKPVLGICRGCQLINVAFGGTLNQGNGVYHKGWHNVLISEDSFFYDYFGDNVDAYHYHKQSVGKLADGFVVTQMDSEDESIIEGIEHKSKPIYGVQWHCDAKKMGEDGEKAFQAFIDVIQKTYYPEVL